MADASSLYAEHPQDVLNSWLAWRQSGPVALVIISQTEGGSVRSPGALMAVAADGRRSGYISGGCIDADVALQAQRAIETGEPLSLRYGAGSPFIDMPLPCGGAIDLLILPNADEAVLQTCHDRLAARSPASLPLAGLSQVPVYAPKMRVRIAGRGADALALARLVQASGYELVLQLRDGEDVDAAMASGLSPITALKSPEALPALEDDPWTAFVLMFHDPDWETALLKQALLGEAFYVGAVGSHRTHARRRERLSCEIDDARAIDRIRGPTGLVPSMRDASMLAISTLAEIIEAFPQAHKAPFADTAVVLLAAGAAERFEGGDKLLAPLNGIRVIDHSAHSLAREAVAARIAIVGPGQSDRQQALEAAGWQVLINPDAASGQASSLKTAIRRIAAATGIKRVLVLLADMPFVPEEHLHALQAAMVPGVPAVMSVADGIQCPPAIFASETFAALLELEGDAGAKSVFRSLPGHRTVALSSRLALDIDTQDDLARAAGTLNV